MNEPVISTHRNGSEIAIIGLAGGFPGAKNIDEFWENLQNGRESISFFTDEELLSSGISSSVLNDPYYVKARGTLEDVEFFDASFFSFNPREAENTDPQHRLFLESAYAALESAGYDSETYKGIIGVYAGGSLSSYLINIYLNQNIINSIEPRQLAIGGDKDHLTTRVSYKLNLEGPSYTVQTACSTSLVAVHLAIMSLLNGECNIALTGGISISAFRKAGYFYTEGGISSPDGHCRAFDAKAQGTVSGEGVGIVVLKRLEDALADGDYVHAVIKGSAINNDGALKVSYTAPRIDGQAKVIRTAQIMAEVEPETITYIEAHGTGTPLGDPIEVAALTQAFRDRTQKKGFCAIGSVKTNIGHLDAAAGIAGLIKTTLALKHKQIPPSLHFETSNPQIDFANSPFYVNDSLSEWKANTTAIPRRAGVSSFGVGGTNAHVILEEASVVEASGPSRPWQLLLFSAKTSTALETTTANIATYLQQHPDLNLADVAYTLQVGRRAFEHRRILVCQDLEDALKGLTNKDPERVFTYHQKSSHRPVVFMFSGQGAQYVNMGRELYQNEPIFKEQVDECSYLLRPHIGLDLRTVLYPSEQQPQDTAQQLLQTAIAQPALFVVEYALAQLWMAWGVYPEAMIGHSIGEYVAATVAGVFSLKDALALVANRGKLMQQCKSGGMLSVQLPEQEVQAMLGRELSLAASNAPNYCVVSGTTKAVEQLQQQLQEKGVGCRRLNVSHAFHSVMMEPIIEPFTQSLQLVPLNPPKIPFVSNVSGTWITEAEATDSNYWARHLRQPVRFSEGIVELVKTQERIFLEVGPGRTLSTFAKQSQREELVTLTSLRHAQEQQSDVAFLLTTLARLCLLGVKINWSGFYTHERRHRIPLPTYPFERQRYWIEPQKQVDTVTPYQVSSNKKPNIANWFYIPSWKRSILPVEMRLTVEEKSCWLVFIDTCGLGSQLVKQLVQKSQDVIIVCIGEQFTKCKENTYTINPRKREDYDVLLKELRSLNKTPKTIVHLWSVTSNNYAQSEIELFEKSQYLGFYSLLFLAQALEEYNFTDPLQIAVVSDSVQEVTGFEVLYPEKATVLGPCKVIPQEYPHIRCKSIDIVIPESETQHEEELANSILSELTLESSDSVVAYRGSHRWVQIFEPVRLQESVKEKLQLRTKGVYLVTGGLGGIGLVLAEYLAQTVQARLILIGRSAFPGRDEWERWLITHDEQNEISCKIRKIQALEKLGAEVMVKSVDVANLEQMQAALAQVYDTFGKVNGVIHAAGIAQKDLFSAIQEISEAECEQQFQPKVHGLFVLKKALQGRALDFCILTSSLSSILGGLRFVAYSAANLFMDAFVNQSKQTSNIPWISVNWDGWKLEQEKEQNTAFESILAELTITPTEGIDAFQRILSFSKAVQVVVSIRDLQTRINQWIKQESLQDTDIPKKVHLSSIHPRPNLQNAYVASHNEVEQIVANIWQELLGIEQVGIYDNFFDLGGNSLISIQVISKIKKELKINIPIVSIYERPTVSSLAELLNREQNELILFENSQNRGDNRRKKNKQRKQSSRK